MNQHRITPKWREEFLNKIVQAREANLFECAKCGHANFQEPVERIHLPTLGNDGKVVLGKGQSVIYLACKNCGLMEFYSFTALGISD